MLQHLKNQRAVVFNIALPIMIQSIAQHFMILTDRAFLGNLNSRYLASIGNVMIPYSALTFFFLSVATGLTVLVAQNVGGKNYTLAQRYGESAFFYSTLFSTGLFLVWLVGAKAIFMLFGASGAILRDAVTFVHIISIYLIFMGIEVSVSSVLQGIGFTRPIMFFGILKSLLNIILDWLLIYGKWIFPAMGLKGAALATLIANFLGAGCLLLSFFMQRNLPFHLSIKGLLKPEWRFYRDTLKVGLPSGFESLLWYAGQLVMVRLLNQIDVMAIGVYSLVSGIHSIAILIYHGFAKAALTLVGQCWGERRFQAAKNIGLYCQKLALMVTLAMAVILVAFPHFLAAIFTSDAGVINRAVPLLRLSALIINFQVINVVIGHAIRATGDTRWMLYSQIFGTVFVIGLSSFMIFGLSLGLIGMYCILILDEFLRGGVNFIRFYYGIEKLDLIRFHD